MNWLTLILGFLNNSEFLDLFKGSEQKKREFAERLAVVLNDNASKQIEVNKTEAKYGNGFAKSWRPMIGYVCAFALAYNFIFQPFLYVILSACGIDFELPILVVEQLITILLGMLGLGGMRTMEKIKLK